MSRPLLSLTLAAALVSAAACQKTADTTGSAATTEAAADSADAMTDATDGTPNSAASPDTMPTAPGATASAAIALDADFMMKAASGGMMEVEAAKLAQKSADPTVKEVAAMILKDHTKANDELKALAAKKDVKLPPAPIGEAKMTLDRLMAASGDGKEFDRMYLDEINIAHEKYVAMFDTQAKNGKDADVKAFAAKTLPALQLHAQMIRKHQKMM